MKYGVLESRRNIIVAEIPDNVKVNARMFNPTSNGNQLEKVGCKIIVWDVIPSNKREAILSELKKLKKIVTLTSTGSTYIAVGEFKM